MPPWFYSHDVIMNPGEPDIPFASPNVCIYCRREPPDVKLTDEHIVPKGIGGNLNFKDASCVPCAEKTGRFEQMVMRESFRYSRGSLGISSGRHKKHRQTHIEVKQTAPHATDHALKFEHGLPYQACFITTPGPPNFFHGENKPGDPYNLEVVFQPHYAEKMVGLVRSQFGDGTYTFKTKFLDGKFCQMLAKIAHSYAAMRLGVQNFRPYLTEYILTKDPLRDFTYIGGHALDVARTPLHELTLIVDRKRIRLGAKYDEKTLVLVELCLFAKLRSPSYLIVVGEPTSDPAQPGWPPRPEAPT